jgi:hypothetical protein
MRDGIDLQQEGIRRTNIEGLCVSFQRETGYRTSNKRNRPISNNQRVGRSSHQHRLQQSDGNPTPKSRANK